MDKTPPSYLLLGPASDFADKRDRRFRRFLEILPGALTWVTLLGIIPISFFRPLWAAFFIIAFDIYWLLNALYFAFWILHSYTKMRESINTNWLALLKNLPPEKYTLKPAIKSWRDLIHLVVFPMYKEGVEIVAPVLEALDKSDYPNEKLWVVLATEERAGEAAREVAEHLKNTFGGDFGKFLITAHPKDLPDEIPGKGSNETYAVKQALKLLIDANRVSYERVLVSVFDSDTRVFPRYFSCLTYKFLTSENPTRASYQPVPLFNNNMWEAPIYSRIPSLGSTAWQIYMQMQPHFQETFSSHSMSLKTLVDVGFWNKRLVNEDSIIFWQCYLAFDGNYRVVSLFYPVSMDANVNETAWKTIVSVYKQHRRWAYGVEKQIYALYGFSKNKKIALRQKIRKSFRLLVGFWTWSCASIILFSLGWLPVIIGGPHFRESVLAFNLPRWTRTLMTVSSLGLLANAILTYLLLPPRPKNKSRWIYATVLLQSLFLPFSIFLFGAVPAIDAQTRMMFGKYLGFWVTKKVRKNVAKDI